MPDFLENFLEWTILELGETSGFLSGFVAAASLSFPAYLLLALVLHWPSFTNVLLSSAAWTAGAGIGTGSVIALIDRGFRP